MDKMQFSNALAEIWNFVRRVNKYIDETTPWVLAKDEANKNKLANVMYTLAESLRIIGILINPAMPNTSKAIFEQLSIKDENLLSWDSTKQFGSLPKDFSITKGNVIFPRIDIEKELEQLDEMIEATKAKSNANNKEEKQTKTEEKSEIGFEDFLKMDFKIGEILECEKIKKSNKLLKSQVKIGDKVIQIVSGIANHYTPEEMVGKRVVVLTNLKPAKLCGEISEGMILAASDNDNNLKIITVEDNENVIKSGAEVK